eukprot:TRINITY_DN89176_c0_g1_i1.p1 TRINITY_DN89176_c0_g1~~TRINITY_DN89176_c0_g1_i1.p1  ORF type:complete len:376 (+),score=214.92 TRINITY_DN89176_c0_g1_i1:46-1173(+)
MLGFDNSSDGAGDAAGGFGSENMNELLQDALEERETLTQLVDELQARVLRFWHTHPRGQKFLEQHVMAADQSITGSREQVFNSYRKLLDQTDKLADRIEERQQVFDDQIDRLNAQLDVQDENAAELADSFKAFKREIARGAEFSRSGKPMKLKRILAFEAAEEEKDKEVESVRLKNIHYMNRLEKLEQDMRKTEELDDGLHLIDFEQRKIENQTLNEKIEERNDEIHKLRKKTTTTVQVLTHVKEKLKFVRGANAVLQEELKQFETQVTNLRDQLTKAKHARDALREENTKLRQKQGFIGSDMLVSDYETRKNEVDVLEGKLAELKDKYARLSKLAKHGNALERQLRSRNSSAGGVASSRAPSAAMSSSYNRRRY